MSLTLISCNGYSAKDLTGNTVPLRSRSPDEQRLKAMKTAMVALAQKFPTDEEMSMAATQEGYEQVIRSILDSDNFKTAVQLTSMNDFEMGGTSGGINYSEPANLAAYLITNNEDYRQILTADYCVDDQLKKINCSSFSTPALAQANAAGAITTRGFLEKWQAAFNFRRVSKVFEVFACSEYPDKSDEGLLPEQLPGTLKTFACQDCVPKCYDCHKTMNSRATLFYTFDRKGFYNPNPNPNPNAGEITVTDTNKASTTKDIVADGVSATYKGTNVASLREYAGLFSQTQQFRNCVTQRVVGRLFGLDHDKPLPESMTHFYMDLEADQFKLKDFIFRVVTSKEFLNR
ncbi:MAG: hypothetical protein H6624_01550 [Bdellovibrionaceae bacterium]|nr:hypothetical protein [Bdellovibrionales bacterium]MCB9082993.1 hypothetical protein [Pseudobdellovibrionaceae bacterium]